MARFFIQRSLRSLLTLWIVVTVVFLAFRLAGDPLTILLPEDTDPAVRAFYIEKWGLNASLPEQYARYFLNILQGNLGQSFVNGRNVTDVIADALPSTLILGTSAFLVSLVLGAGAGIIAALNHNKLADRITMLFAVMAYSMPDYILGVLLIIVFALELRWLPTSGNDTWRHMILPLVTLSTSAAARTARFSRSAMLEVLNAHYLRTARSKGLRERTVILRHALRNALIPVITILGFQLGFLVGGAAIVETVFAWPGIGRLFVSSVSTRDLPVVQAVALLVATGVILANLLVDVAYGFIDPRISLAGEGK
ncbi:MAG: ABC transporter permease [Anaerolineae bacterium]|nr:ABC transporter permease [Anaerolineae bacterium]MCA9909856.1 ABC transporter permease [Anaerolineae bacterium]